MKSVFVILGLLVCVKAAGSRAQTPVFVKTGEDLHLEVKKTDVPEEFVLLLWRFNGSVNLVTFLPGREPTVSDRYRGRVEVENFSVKLNNLQKSDSGVYAAQVTTTEESPTLPGYVVTVEDPVSPVKLTVDSVTNSSDSCDLTVTCRSLDSHQISISTNVTCNTTTCSQEGGERSKVTTSGATLHVYLLNDQIICNHSNQVSRTNDSIMIGRFCPRHTDPEPLHGQNSTILVVVIALIIAAAVGVMVMVHLKQRRNRESIENSTYAEAGPGRPVDQSQDNDASGLSSTYALVGPHTRSTETRGNAPPESPYAEVH